MDDPIELAAHRRDGALALTAGDEDRDLAPPGRPSNDVYARVGDTVLDAARDGVRRGMRPEDIIREIQTAYQVRLSLGEFRLLLAARRI